MEESLKAILIDEKRLDAMRDAMLNKLKANPSRHTNIPGDPALDYRTVHYLVHEFVNAIKEDK